MILTNLLSLKHSTYADLSGSEREGRTGVDQLTRRC